jgi:Trk K+ transport system NAD-binding subunit
MPPSAAQPYILIIGYGMPGRAVAEMVRERGVDLTVIELNESTVHRCEGGGPKMIAGDARDPQVLQRAEISRASLIVIALPDEHVGLEVTRQARKLNATATIVTRCHYVSVGFELRKAGASEVVISEQVVAEELRGLISPLVGSSSEARA